MKIFIIVTSKNCDFIFQRMYSQIELYFMAAQDLKAVETLYDSFSNDWIHSNNAVEVAF